MAWEWGFKVVWGVSGDHWVVK